MKKSTSNSILPVFLPHLGCPKRCIFCDQNIIGGRWGKNWADLCLRKGKRIKEIGFFGGSFTCIPKHKQKELLDWANVFIKEGAVDEIRVSTRPDCIDENSLLFLKENNVKTVEIGVVSFDNRVLYTSERGYDAKVAKDACLLVKKVGIKLGVQIMFGLPDQTLSSFLKTVHETLKISPDFVIIYPVVVILGTKLFSFFKSGRYKPLSLCEAIDACKYATSIFLEEGIKVARIGIQNENSLDKTIVAGPYHPSFGELVYQNIFFDISLYIGEKVAKGEKGVLIYEISEFDESKFRGYKNENMRKLKDIFGHFELRKKALPKGYIRAFRKDDYGILFSVKDVKKIYKEKISHEIGFC